MFFPEKGITLWSEGRLMIGLTFWLRPVNCYLVVIVCLFDLSFFHNLFICSCNVFVPIPAVWISQMFTLAEQCIKFHVVLQWIVLNGIQNTIYLHMQGMTRINIRLMKVNFWDCSLSLLLYCSNLYFLFQVFSEYMALRTHEIRERHCRSWRVPWSMGNLMYTFLDLWCGSESTWKLHNGSIVEEFDFLLKEEVI